MLKHRTTNTAFSYLIYLGCAIAFCTIPFGSATGRNLYYVSSYIAFIAVCLYPRYYLSNVKNLLLPALMFSVGMGNAWGQARANKCEKNSVNSGVSVTNALTCAACQRAIASASAP